MRASNVFEAARRAFPGCIVNDSACGRLIRFAPDPNRPHKKSGYLVVFDDGGGVVGDFRTDYQEYVPAGEDRFISPSERRQRMQAARTRMQQEQRERQDSWAERAEVNLALWASGVEIEKHCAVGKYLRARGLDYRDLHHAVRSIPKLPYYSDNKEHAGTYPAMLAAITDVDGALVSVHRTYLDGLGGKALVDTPRKVTPASGPMAGCSIKLSEPKLLGGKWTIGVAEGIETALACRFLFHTPIVSAVNAGMLARFKWPSSLARLRIYPDNDANHAGQNAAHTLATRAQRSGLSVKVKTPKNTGDDWADVLEAALAED